MHFSIQPNLNSRESLAVFSCVARYGVTYKISKDPIDAVPIGSVSYCERFLSKPPIVDFYPEFLNGFLNRKIESKTITNSFVVQQDCFIKDASGWKTDFISRVYKRGEVIPAGSYLFSEIISIRSEWRYYVCDGEVICSGWYDGEESDPPQLDFFFPSWYNGAVDFGMSDFGLTLIESHAPYACGWYGEKHIDYITWQYNAWKSYKKYIYVF